MGFFSRSNSDTEIKVNNEKWQMFFRWMENGDKEFPIMMFFDETYAEKQPNDYKYGIEFSVFVPNDGDHVHPESIMIKSHVNQDFIDKEPQMESMIEGAQSHTKLVAKLVGIGRKVYRFQTRDPKKLTAILNDWADLLQFNQRVEVESRKDWTYYTGIIPNLAERQQISDRHIIEQAMANGAKEEKNYKCNFTFTGTDTQLLIIKDDLEEEGFQTLNQDEGRLSLQRELPLDLKTISHFTSYMLMSAMAHECTFDGWGCHLN